MKKFKAKSIDLKQMSNVRGGGVEVTLDNLKINTTKHKQQLVSSDFRVEISGTLTVEK